MAKSSAVASKPAKKCPLTQAEYLDQAKAFALQIGMTGLVLEPKVFASGSVGFYVSGKVVINIGDTPVTHQASFNLVAVGSKVVEE